MRFVLGFLSGLLGMLAGWSALAALLVGPAGSGGDGGTVMGAFFQIGPLGGVVGFAIAVRRKPAGGGGAAVEMNFRLIDDRCMGDC